MMDNGEIIICSFAFFFFRFYCKRRVMGTLTVRLRISGKDGRVMEVSALTDTLIPDPTDLVYDEDGQPIDVCTYSLKNQSMCFLAEDSASHSFNNYILVHIGYAYMIE